MMFILHPVRTLYVSQPLGVYLLAEYVRSRAAKKTITSAGQTSPVVSARFVWRPLLSSHSSNLRNVSASGACTVLFTPGKPQTYFLLHRNSFWSIKLYFHRNCNGWKNVTMKQKFNIKTDITYIIFVDEIYSSLWMFLIKFSLKIELFENNLNRVLVIIVLYVVFSHNNFWF